MEHSTSENANWIRHDTGRLCRSKVLHNRLLLFSSFFVGCRSPTMCVFPLSPLPLLHKEKTHMDDKKNQHIDPRPKRRKSKDNPYSLFTVGIQHGSPQYYVSFKTTSGHHVCMEIAQSIFEALDKFELNDLRYLNEIDNHYEHSEMTEASLSKRAMHKPECFDDTVLSRMQNERLKKYIAMLPAIQRKRLVMHYYGQFTCKQLAELDNCSVIAVKKSLETARKNLKKLIEGDIPSSF